MESARRPGSATSGGGGLPRSTFADDFFGTDPFRGFDPQPQHPPHAGLPRRFTERGAEKFEIFNNFEGRLFDDDFFDGFANGNAHGHQRAFHDESPVFRSSLPRRSSPYSSSSNSNLNGASGGNERQIPVQRQQTTPQWSPKLERKDAQSAPFQHQRSKSYYDHPTDNNNAYGGWGDFDQQHQQHPKFNDFHHQEEPHHFRQFPHQQQHPNDPPPNVHRIHIQHEQQPTGRVHQKPRQFVEINNAQPNYANGSLNPDKRRRFSNAMQPGDDHSGANNKMHASSIPNITIDDYSDGRLNSDNEQPSPPTVIPLPAPAIPLPPPERMMQQMGTETAKKEGKENEETCVKNEQKCSENVEMAMESDENEVGNVEIVDEEASNVKPQQIPFVPLAATGEHLVRLLDQTEHQVEMLRETAARLEQEKETILETLKNIKISGDLLKLDQGDRDELELNADRILSRCRAVEVCVQTPRDEHQNHALRQVNQWIDAVLAQMQEDLAHARARVRGALNACMPDEAPGYIDEKFQSLIIACTADDQKKIRRRLAQIMEQIERAQQFASSPSEN